MTGSKLSLGNLFSDRSPILGQDPHLTQWQGKYLLCESQDEERIALGYLTDQGRDGTRVVWSKPGEHQIWAPELHQLDGLWYLYYAASDGRNTNHRTMVAGAASSPFGPYYWSERIGPDVWGIDMTVFSWKGARYAVWSGWEHNDDEFPQHLYIAPMVSPVEVGDRVRICSPELDWETSIAAVVEGPQAWKEPSAPGSPEGLCLLYSANASWMPDYSTGALELIHGGDPLKPQHWLKAPFPLMQNAGHGHMIDGLFVYHRKLSSLPGWQDREIRTVEANTLNWQPSQEPAVVFPESGVPSNPPPSEL